MVTFYLRVVSVLLISLPAVVSAATLDDYYLSRLAPQQQAYSKKLSGGIAPAPTQPVRSLTSVRHAVKKDWAKLEPATQQVLAKVLPAPSLSGERTCTPVGGHFTIHYATSGSDAVDLADANQNNVPDWVEKVAGVFEYVFDVEVNKMGYRPPPSPPYHVYLQNLESVQAYGFTEDYYAPSFPPAGVTSAATFITIDKGFTAAIYRNTSVGTFTPEQSLRVTAAHEFHHAIQFAYNYYFDPFFAEMTSTWIEDEVYDSVNQLYSYLPSYLPHTDSVALNAAADGSTEYGRWLFNRYMVESQGTRTVMRAFWEELATKDSTNHQDIPAFDVLNDSSVLNGNLGNIFFGFARSLMQKNLTTHLLDLSFIPSVRLSGTFDVHGIVQAPINSLNTPYTFAYYCYRPAAADGQDLSITFPALVANSAVTAFKIDSTGLHEYQYNTGTQSIQVPSFTSDSVVYLLVCNNGNGDMGSSVQRSFPLDSDNSLDGSASDAIALAIPVDTPLPTGSTSIGSSTSSSKSGCFIATAAYGSYLHPKVALLREFRDRCFLTNAPGRLFVACYYRLSPPVADFIARHEALKQATRLALVPLILAVEHPRAALFLLCLVIAAAVGGALRAGRFARDKVPA